MKRKIDAELKKDVILIPKSTRYGAYLIKLSLTQPHFEQSHPVGKLRALRAHCRQKLEMSPGQ